MKIFLYSPKGDCRFWGLLKTRLLLSGDSKSLDLLGYCYTIEGHHLNLHCQNWWTLPLNITIQDYGIGCTKATLIYWQMYSNFKIQLYVIGCTRATLIFWQMYSSTVHMAKQSQLTGMFFINALCFPYFLLEKNWVFNFL